MSKQQMSTVSSATKAHFLKYFFSSCFIPQRSNNETVQSPQPLQISLYGSPELAVATSYSRVLIVYDPGEGRIGRFYSFFCEMYQLYM